MLIRRNLTILIIILVICVHGWPKEPQNSNNIDPMVCVGYSDLLEKVRNVSYDQALLDTAIRLHEKAKTASEPVTVTSEVTAYCACPLCCGDSADGITATGVVPQQGRTIATDWNYLPRGTRVKIEGFDTTFIVEDTFGKVYKGYRIDIYFDDHEEARQFGRRTLKIEILD